MPVDSALAAGACDCHVHVVGPTDRFPQSPRRSYTAQRAPLDSLRALAEPAGVSRFVIVQASFYGTDNSCLLETLDALGKNGRGVVAVDSRSVTPKLLAQYARRRVCGLRINLYSKGLLIDPDQVGELLTATIDKLPTQGWHIEIIAPISLLLNEARTVADSPAPIVLDHYGLPGEFSPESPEGRNLLALVALPHVWVKLTAPYRTMADSLASAPPASWLAALLRTAPDRCVWGSDWPHTPPEREQTGAHHATPYRKILYRRLIEDFVAAIPDRTLLQRILIDNPERLYGFHSS
jgi:predicted TIM-barrel fold metal-dependent hydrolase